MGNKEDKEKRKRGMGGEEIEDEGKTEIGRKVRKRRR